MCNRPWLVYAMERKQICIHVNYCVHDVVVCGFRGGWGKGRVRVFAGSA